MRNKNKKADVRAGLASGRSRLEVVVLAAAAALALVAIARFVALEVPQLEFPYAVNYGEGVVLDQANRIATGAGLYRPLADPPFVIDNYTPLYPYLASLALPPGGVSFTGGRLLSFIACLVAACILGWLAFAGRTIEDASLRVLAAGVAGAGLFLGAGEVLSWGALYRVDCLGVALSVAGFAVVASDLRRAPLLAAPLFIASLAVRQSLLAAPLAGYLAALLRDRRQAFLGGALCALLAGAGVAVGTIATDGNFLAHVVRSNVLPFDWPAVWSKYLEPLIAGKPALLAAAAVAGVALRRDRRARPFLFFAAAELVFAFSMGRKGADINYLLLPIAALALLAGRGIAYAPRQWQRLVAAGLVALQISLSLALERPRIGAEDRAAIAARDRAVLERVARLKGPILFEEPSLALLSGRTIDYEPFMATQLAAIGRWDPAPLVAAIRERRYVAVQRTAWLQAQPGRQPAPLYLGDRTVPALADALERCYVAGPLDQFARPIAPGLFEAYVLWFPAAKRGP
jgi:hypothetical protein